VDADKLLDALRGSPGGMTRTGIRDLFGRNKKPEDLQRILNLLERAGKARSQSAVGEAGGRPTETWFANE
jgi:predicted DNA-binding ArsR family transcriptional regulator